MNLARIDARPHAALKALAISALALVLASALPAVARSAAPPRERTIEIRPPRDLPNVPVTAFGGGETSLADLKGRPVVLNFWATWCSPCVAELPALNALAKSFGDKDPRVVAVSVDRGGAPTVEKFLAGRNLGALAFYLDPPNKLIREVGTQVLPLTLFVDADGREVGRLYGDADWTAPGTADWIRSLFKAPLTKASSE